MDNLQDMVDVLEKSIVAHRTARKNHRVGNDPEYIIHVDNVLIDPASGQTNVRPNMASKYGKSVAETIAAKWKNGAGTRGTAEKFVHYCMRQEAMSRELLEKIKAA